MSRARDTADQINRVNSSAADATAITVDSSENVLVGKTSANNTDVGTTIYSTLGFSSTRSGGVVGIINRTTNDGDIMQFRKDGTTVGSIGTTGGKLFIGSPDGSDAFLRFESNEISPCTSTGAFRSGAISLGKSDSQFKDLYLSGGAYLGGTGSANKLDDYEEGTWTPTGEGITYSTASGSYVKVGRMVMITYNITFPSTGNTGGAQINSLPFSATVGNAYQSGGYIAATNGGSAAETLFLTVATNRLVFRDSGNNNKTNNQFSQDFIQGSAVYTTD